MRVLVTGHNGYLGTVMVPMLQGAGHEVVGLDTNLFATCVCGPLPEETEHLRIDLRDVRAEHLRRFDAVIHLAALSNDPLGNVAPRLTYAINFDASLRLAELAKAAGVTRFLQSSSCSIYGAGSGDGLVDETAPMRPVTPYADAKVRLESGLRAMADDKFSPIYLRNGTAYGFSPRLRGDLVLNNLVAHAMLTGIVKVLSDGTPWRPMVHAEDIARAFIAALEAPRESVHDEAFNVGSEAENYRVSDLATIVSEVVPQSTVVIAGEAGSDQRSYRVDFSKIRTTIPAFAPRWTARLGAMELLDRYQAYGLTMDQLDEQFTRLRWISHLQATKRLDEDLTWASADAVSNGGRRNP